MGHSPSLRILFLSANRIMAPRMAIDEELTAIEHALRGRPGECGLVSQVDLTPDQFIAAIQSHPADILHISAHAENGRIHLQGKGKQSIGFGELVELLGVTAKKFGPPRLVILNACDTEAGLALLCKHVDCAIGMSTRISEHVAYLFTSTFYACLGRGLSVDQAFSVTLLRLQMSDQVSNEAPRLARREGVDTSELVLLPVRQPRGGRGARVIGNRYEVPPDNLGRGSKATVYKALDLWSDSTEHVALRLLHVNPAHNGAIVARFFHGAEQAHKLSHPNIVRVLDIGPREGADLYYVMELLEAPETLMDYAARRRLDAAAVFRLGMELVDALDYAHQRGLYHRDVRPDNILIDREGRPRLVHFDLVREAVAGSGTFGPLGIPAYTAPEVLGDARVARPESDQYSLAMTLAAAIVGREAEPKLNVDAFLAPIPEPFAAVLRRATSDRPEQRYGRLRAFYADLEMAAAGSAPLPRVPTSYAAPGPAPALTAGSAPGTARQGAPAPAPDTARQAAPAPAPETSRQVAPAPVPKIARQVAPTPVPETSRQVAPAPTPKTAMISAPAPAAPATSRRTIVTWTATSAALVIFAVMMAAAWSGPQESTSPPVAAPSGGTPPAIALGRSVSDAELDEVLRVDHSKTAFAIRITADNTLEEAREDARAVLRTSRFQPWIVRQRQGKGLYIVYVGGYSNREKALADFEAAKAVRREGGYVKFMPEDCPRLEWTPAGYHNCAR